MPLADAQLDIANAVVEGHSYRSGRPEHVVHSAGPHLRWPRGLSPLCRQPWLAIAAMVRPPKLCVRQVVAVMIALGNQRDLHNVLAAAMAAAAFCTPGRRKEGGAKGPLIDHHRYRPFTNNGRKGIRGQAYDRLLPIDSRGKRGRHQGNFGPLGIRYAPVVGYGAIGKRLLLRPQATGLSI